MRLKTLRQTGLAFAAVAVLAAQAQAQVFVNYTDGNLLLGFQQNGTAENVVANLGAATQFKLGGTYYSPGVGIQVTGLTLSADLTSVFGASWASNSQPNLLQWGVVGGNDGTLALPLNTLYYTQGRLNTAVSSTARNRQGNGIQGVINGEIQGFGSQFTGYEATGSSVTAILSGGEWSAQNPTTAPFGNAAGWSNIQQPVSGLYTGPTNSVLDLYEAQPGSGAATRLGSFTLDSSGAFSFTAVPEPSTYALMGLGLVALFVLRRKAKPLVVKINH